MGYLTYPYVLIHGENRLMLNHQTSCCPFEGWTIHNDSNDNGRQSSGIPPTKFECHNCAFFGYHQRWSSTHMSTLTLLSLISIHRTTILSTLNFNSFDNTSKFKTEGQVIKEQDKGLIKVLNNEVDQEKCLTYTIAIFTLNPTIFLMT